VIKGHTYIGWISLIAGVINLILFFFVGFEIEWETGMLISLALGAISLVTGLVARFEKAKDNFGVAGISLGILVPIMCLVW
jgi:hypothetical protein